MIKLNHFPPTHLDEDFRSIFLRYVKLTGIALVDLNSIFFDLNSRSLPLINPQNINNINDSLHENLKVDTKILLENHSYVSVLRMFYKDSQSICNNRAIHFGNDRVGKRVLSHEIRYCPNCIKRDYEETGEVYFRRKHQLSDVDFCLEHGCKLISKCPNCMIDLTDRNGRWLLSTICCSKCFKPVYLEEDISPLWVQPNISIFNIILDQLLELFTMTNEEYTSLYLRGKYSIYLDQYRKKNGDVVFGYLFKNLNEYYGLNVVDLLRFQDAYALSYLLDFRMFHSTYYLKEHLLLMKFFSGSTRKFLTKFNGSYNYMLT
ncbi:TniQ family protein [Paenibacillus sp. LjRoot153]|uniref:TniQ family protein n=1 Tax=Paenibacillus sp. LjRoot153 TaxID=3342270 RepID=UPI003ECE4B73